MRAPLDIPGSAEWPIVGKKRRRQSKGYFRLLVPTHPNADVKGYVYEHTYRASLVLGRGLRPHETVHHIDGNPSNNENHNLLICTKSYHRQLHVKLGESAEWPQFTSRANNRDYCQICGEPIRYQSVSGLCVAHYFQSIRDSTKQCSMADCDGKAGSRSGLCLRHVSQRADARRKPRDRRSVKID